MFVKSKPASPVRRSAGNGAAYRTYAGNNMILRDRLAYDRTVLALERTVLAYARTAFILVSTSVTVLKFLGNEPAFLVIGMFLAAAAGVTFIFGTRRFIDLRKKLGKIYGEKREMENGTHETIIES